MKKDQAFSETRCAIYTRKSSTVRLDVPFNTLETQRELCSAFIRSQAHRNWSEIAQRYDDGGFSGGSMERPALRNLIGDIEAGRVDLVVVYKIDRLSRSLNDFIRLIDTLDRYGVGFVSVTQTFDTSDSMGRLVLNILLTFAQFERELMSDRVRDKKAALMRRGLFVGGTPPFGYRRTKDGRLILDPEYSPIVQEIFRRFQSESARAIATDLARRGVRTAHHITKSGKQLGGQPIYTGRILAILRNPIYTGHIVHRNEWLPAQFVPLVTRDEFDAVQTIAKERFPAKRDPVRNFLLGILHDEHGRRMRIQGGTGRARQTRYYKSENAGWAKSGVARRVMVGADAVEALTLAIIRSLLTDRVRLKNVILSLGLYSDQIGKRLKKGHTSAKRMAAFDQEKTRCLVLALVARAEVAADSLRLFLSCHELARFLAWDGNGIFSKDPTSRPRDRDKVHEERAFANMIAGHLQSPGLVQPCADAEAKPQPHLVSLLEDAVGARNLVMANRNLSEVDLARQIKVGTRHFGRLLRLNYLAPDIQTAIYDGTQPLSVSRRSLLAPIPLDWDQQRHLLGFAPN